VKVTLKSGPVNYEDAGKGPAVLLLHAFPLNNSMWSPQIGLLSGRFRVIAPDLRGFGGSKPI
jgi:pimeloyl-ACP methyl ester carboxylesterase